MTAVHLPDFLLARIADDEAPTWTLSPYACAPGCCAPEGWVGSQCRYCDPAPVYGGTVAAITRIAEEHAETVHQRTHVLAECDAKRRIVNSRPAIGTPGACLHVVHDEVQRQRDYVWKLLALPYADHPDYDEAWRL